MSRSRRTLAATTAALLLAPIPAAGAQSLDPAIASSRAVGSLDPVPVAQALGAVGSSDFPAVGSSEPGEAHPSPVDPTITHPEVIAKRQDGAVQIWTIASASMQRRIDVEVYPSRSGRPAPMLYLLDGVNSPLPSGWRSLGGVEQYFANQNANVVVPTGGYASFWTDWQSDDPTLGRNRWESFLTTELPGLVEPSLSTNGRRGIGGISMGGQAATHLAATHPDMYFANQNANVVVPTGGYASFWTDWQSDDPTLGRNRWESFLTTELPGLVEPSLSTNGRRGIGGISMGGQAATHLAATHPDMYDAVMSISGTYSTTDEIGYQTARLTVETRGGRVENMWGPRGGAAWQAHDTMAHPEGLRGKAVYLSSGNGVAGLPDTQAYNGDVKAFATGILLEKAVLDQTARFDRRLSELGIDHHVDYTDTGLHNWKTFAAQFDPGWRAIAGRLGA